MSADKLYVVVTVVTDKFRIVDDKGEPILVEQSRFEIVDDWIPSDWVEDVDVAEGWYWYGPKECSAPGFFERWFDGEMTARQAFAELYSRLWDHHKPMLAGQSMVVWRGSGSA